MATFAARKTIHKLSESMGFYEFEAILGNYTLNSDFSNLDLNTQLIPLNQNLTGVYPMKAKTYQNM